MRIHGPESTTREWRSAVTADHLLNPEWTGSDVLVTTTDGLCLLLKDATADGSGRITAQLSIHPSTGNQRLDLTSIDGCAIDFAPSTPLSNATAFTCRVFGIKGAVGCLRIPGIQDVRPVNQ